MNTDRAVIRFTQPGVSGEPERRAIVAPHDHMDFSAMPAVPIRPHRVLVACKTPGAVRATRLFIPCFGDAVCSAAIADGLLEWAHALIDPGAHCTVRVENTSDTPQEVRVALLCDSSIAPDSKIVESYIMSLAARPTDGAPGAKLCVKAWTKFSVRVQPPVACRPRKIVMRSDAPYDIDVETFQFANIQFVDGPVSVQTFVDGLDVRAPGLQPANSMCVTLSNATDKDHWVEIDVEAERL